VTRLLATAVLSLALGLLLGKPLAAAALLLPTVAIPRLRPVRTAALAFLAGTLLAGPERPSPLRRALPEGAHLVTVEGIAKTGADRSIGIQGQR